MGGNLYYYSILGGRIMIRVSYDDGAFHFEGQLIAEHIHDDTWSLILLDSDYVGAGESDRLWCRNDYFYYD